MKGESVRNATTSPAPQRICLLSVELNPLKRVVSTRQYGLGVSISLPTIVRVEAST